MNGRLLAFTAAVIFAMIGLVFEANSAPSLPGEPLGLNTYVVSFSATRAGFYVTYDPVTGDSYDLVPDTGVILDGFLAFRLPEAVVTGDVAFEGYNDGDAIEAGLRFLEENGTYYMEPFSPRAAGFPPDFNFAFVGGELNDAGAINYVPGGVYPYISPTIFYGGYADTPETSTWAMMALGFAGLGFAGYRASRKAIAFV
jgi:hypothetical protein